MAVDPLSAAAVDLAHGEHFSCSLSAVLLARVAEFGGETAVARLLRQAGSRRSRDYLMDISHWIAYAEAEALWGAGAAITHHPDFAHAIGADSAHRLAGTPVAALLRSLGAPEHVYRQIAAAGAKYTTVKTLHTNACEPGYAEVEARPASGFPCSADSCRWTMGLLASATTLFGLPPATVSHETCSAYGAPVCKYRLRWPVLATPGAEIAPAEVASLQAQIEAMQERLHGVFTTASDLIGSDEIEQVLARIAARAAGEVRAPRHLLAVRMSADGPLRIHSRGFSPDAAQAAAARLLAADLSNPGALPGSWLAVPVASDRRVYGRILAAFPAPGFIPQERELLQVYARFAASALDGASALERATSRERESRALLELAHELAVAGTQSELAHRIVESLHVVVDCDRVAVYLNEPEGLVREAVSDADERADALGARSLAGPSPGPTLRRLLEDPQPQLEFVDLQNSDVILTGAMRALGLDVVILVPLVSGRTLLGVLSVSVRGGAERLRLTEDLRRRLSGVAAEAGTALQNGRLLDLVTYQALHDGLTGLANRAQFAAELRLAVERAERTGQRTCVFYLDLDGFKPVNDALGHEAGDELLVAVADRLRACVRAGDVVARVGGDEFALLVVASGEDELEGVLARVSREFAVPFKVAGRRQAIAVSVGRAVCPDDTRDPTELVRLADAAMFAEKRSASASDPQRAAAHSPRAT